MRRLDGHFRRQMGEAHPGLTPVLRDDPERHLHDAVVRLAQQQRCVFIEAEVHHGLAMLCASHCLCAAKLGAQPGRSAIEPGDQQA